MKKFILLISAVALIGLSNTANAQVSVNVNINSQPSWGPSGYQYARYYYLPDLNIYYDVANTLFYYLSGGKWLTCRSLPSRYSRYNLYNTYKVVINKPRPWMHHHTYVQEYSRYRGNSSQVPIRDYNNRNMQRGGSNGNNGGQQSNDNRQSTNNRQSNRQQSNHKRQSNDKNGQQSNDRQQDQQRNQN